MSHRIYFGDNLPILESLPSESVDLIYINQIIWACPRPWRRIANFRINKKKDQP
jgi:DNA modification methylase